MIFHFEAQGNFIAQESKLIAKCPKLDGKGDFIFDKEEFSSSFKIDKPFLHFFPVLHRPMEIKGKAFMRGTFSLHGYVSLERKEEDNNYQPSASIHMSVTERVNKMLERVEYFSDFNLIVTRLNIFRETMVSVEYAEYLAQLEKEGKDAFKS